MSERQFRRYRDRYEEEGRDGLRDKRLGKRSAQRVPERELRQRQHGRVGADCACNCLRAGIAITTSRPQSRFASIRTAGWPSSTARAASAVMMHWAGRSASRPHPCCTRARRPQGVAWKRRSPPGSAAASLDCVSIRGRRFTGNDARAATSTCAGACRGSHLNQQAAPGCPSAFIRASPSTQSGQLMCCKNRTT